MLVPVPNPPSRRNFVSFRFNDQAQLRFAIPSIRVLAIAGLALLQLALAGCTRNQADVADLDRSKSPREATSLPPAFQFTDVTSKWGVDFTYRNGFEHENYTILESLGGGIGVIDYDRDGRADLFCPGGGTFAEQQTVGLPAELYRNIDGQHMIAVAQPARSNIPRYYSHGASVADYDGDGFSDVLVTGYGGLQLWQNQGDGTFLEAQQATALIDNSWSSSAAWADYNNDGVLDLYVAHYVDWSFSNHPICRGRTADERDICAPREYSGLPDSLYLGNGDGTFSDATEAWQLQSDGKGLGVVAADFDNNGFVDVYVANDTVNNFLYANSGSGPLTDVGAIAGVATDKFGIPNGSMGVDVIDFNHDGLTDIWVTNYEREDFALYRSEGPASFLHVSDILGLNVLGGLFVGFGTVCSDFDLDGREDILVNNGHVILYPTISTRAQLPVAMHADEKRFRRAEFNDDSYMMQPHEGRGLALADIDSDGDLDPIFSNLNARLGLLTNDLLAPANWLQVRLVGTKSARDAIGAQVMLSVGEQQLLRIRKGGGSYLSTSQEALAWGLGGHDKVDRLTVRWPSGGETTLVDVNSNQVLVLVEPNDG
jgi:enediyne biosynthesis protein E4